MKKYIKLISISVIILIIAGFIIIPKILSTKEKSQRNQSPGSNQQNQALSVDGYVVKEQSLDNEIKTIGTIRANEEVELRSEVSRKVVGIYFKEGTSVSRGKVLFKLDASDLSARLKKQEIDEQLAINQLEREKYLIDKGLTPQETYETVETNLARIRADMEITRVDITKTSIRAPFSGVIGLRNVSIGSYVTPTIVLATIQDVSKIKIDFSIPEKYSPMFKVGQRVVFNVEGVPGDFEAEVFAFEPKVENNTRTLVLRAIASNPGKKLMPGNFANVTLKLSTQNNAILIPSQALVPKLKGQSVYVIKDGVAKTVDVEIGERTENNVQITTGLYPGDTVITTNILRLRPEAKVKMVKAE
ncbi:MAG: efflux RND transporter periplasmic adaptor subunit [Ignavibacteriae bacterium]|nr:MAG: efflux RND transporter periplasmic adaptor subunit [Ignavibacteriota bacterium]